MNGYRIGLVIAENFGPFVRAEYDLSRPGLTVIEGEYVGHGADSNGSGKSKLLEAPVWCVYGRLLRERVPNDEVVRLLFKNVGGGNLEAQRDERGALLRPDGGCRVETHLVNGPRPVKIVRYQGHPGLGNRVELYIDGTDVTQGRDAMTQEAIEREIGLDYRTFVNSVAFGAGDDVRSFFSATDSERKRIMERLLALGGYAAAESLARARVRAEEGKRDEEERRQTALKATLVSLRGVQDEMASRADSDVKRRQLERVQRRRIKLARLVEPAREKASQAKRRMRKLEREAIARERAYEAALVKFERRKVKLERRVRAAERAYEMARAEVRTTLGAAARTTGLAGKSCPTCRQTVSGKFAERALAEARTLAAAGEAEADRIANEVLAPLRDRLERLTEPERPNKDDYANAREGWRGRRSRYLLVTTRLEAVQEAARVLEDEWREAQSRAATIEANIEATTRDLAASVASIRTLRRSISRLSFWVEGFGNGGVKSFLIEAEIPNINRLATQYARRLLGPGSHVRLSATRDLKSGAQREELVVHGVIPGCTVSYANASKGQKKRLDLCVLLAFRDLLGRRSTKAFEQFFADELFDGLDETGEEFVVDLLRELSSRCPVALVTHSPRLKSVGDWLITVRHDGGTAKVETVRPTRAR